MRAHEDKRLSLLATIEQRLILRRLGVLQRHDVQRLHAALRQILGPSYAVRTPC
jgi:hypothetical protein